jgi:hypothetical protein
MFYVQVKEIGPNNFCKPNERLIWNINMWLEILMDFASRFDDKAYGSKCELSSEDCWLLTLTKDGEKIQDQPQVSTRPYHIKEIQTNEDGKQHEKEFMEKNESNIQFQHVAAFLSHGLPGTKGDQASHRCFNNPQYCANPSHFCWEISAVNKSRWYCQNGSLCTCPHSPKCVWTSPDGKYPPFRNQQISKFDCNCNGNCLVSCVTIRVIPSFKMFNGSF